MRIVKKTVFLIWTTYILGFSQIIFANEVLLKKSNRLPLPPYDFTTEKQSIKASLEVGEVTIKGARYRAFRGKYGTIYLPRLHYFTPSDIMMARCTGAEIDRTVVVKNGSDTFSNSNPNSENIPLLEVSRMNNSGFKFYARAIQETIRNVCGQNESNKKTVALKPSLEIGISYDNGDEEYSVFFNPLAFLLGFRV